MTSFPNAILIRTLTLLAAGSVIGAAQVSGNRLHSTNLNSWWVYAGDHPIKGPWGVYAEIQIRRTDFANAWQQFQSRDAFTYRISPNIQLAGGYVFTYTGRYGEFPVARVRSFNEHRTYQQIILRHSAGKLALEHRYRNEQRWGQSYRTLDDYSWLYTNRFRYQLKASLPITRADSAGHQWYLFGGDELFIRYGSNHGPSAFDQNRVFAGIGYSVSKNNKLEAGYLNQFLVQTNNLFQENDHTFRLQWSSSVPVTQLFHF